MWRLFVVSLFGLFLLFDAVFSHQFGDGFSTDEELPPDFHKTVDELVEFLEKECNIKAEKSAKGNWKK